MHTVVVEFIRLKYISQGVRCGIEGRYRTAMLDILLTDAFYCSEKVSGAERV